MFLHTKNTNNNEVNHCSLCGIKSQIQLIDEWKPILFLVPLNEPFHSRYFRSILHMESYVFSVGPNQKKVKKYHLPEPSKSMNISSVHGKYTICLLYDRLIESATTLEDDDSSSDDAQNTINSKEC